MGLHLPPLSDSSLTMTKLNSLVTRQSLALPQMIVNPNNLKIRHSSRRIKEAIDSIFTDPLRFWFDTGRLPRRSYLIEVLYALDPENPVFSKNVEQHNKRYKVIRCKCKRCYRQMMKYNRTIPFLMLTHEPDVIRPALAPHLVPAFIGIVEQARAVFHSRHGLIRLDPNVTESQLTAHGFNKPTIQAKIQNEISRIDSILDSLIRL